MISEKELIKQKEKLRNYVLELMIENENLTEWLIKDDRLKYTIQQSDGFYMVLTLQEFCSELTIWVTEPTKNGTGGGYITNFKIVKENEEYDYFRNLLKIKSSEAKQEELRQEKSTLDRLETELKKTDKKLIRRFKLKNLKK
jgi:hypothetical protein